MSDNTTGDTGSSDEAASNRAAGNVARAERQALADTFISVGPDAPTLCAGWTTRDLAAHLVIREHRPDALLGIFVPTFSAHTAKVQRDVAAADWADLVQRVRSGPPPWNPSRIDAVNERVNTGEFFVHHEDVLRAQPGWTARPVPDRVQRTLWQTCQAVSRIALRRAPVGVELLAQTSTTESTSGPTSKLTSAKPTLGLDAKSEAAAAVTRFGQLTARRGQPSVRITGPPAEILLYLFGRRTVAAVELDGPEQAIKHLQSSPSGV